MRSIGSALIGLGSLWVLLAVIVFCGMLSDMPPSSARLDMQPDAEVAQKLASHMRWLRTRWAMLCFAVLLFGVTMGGVSFGVGWLMIQSGDIRRTQMEGEHRRKIEGRHHEPIPVQPDSLGRLAARAR